MKLWRGKGEEMDVDDVAVAMDEEADESSNDGGVMIIDVE